MVIARSFARIFYRNAINTGVLPLVCEQADAIGEGSEIRVFLEEGVIEAEGGRYPIEPVPGFFKAIVEAGGLVAWARTLEEVELCTGSRR
jgi:3-isopropylmalate/(R)-2-methylmalate dehydratase small subunit